MCDDLSKTMSELESRGAQFSGEPHTRDFGVTVLLKVPGADDIMLYEPRHPTAYDLD
jgi:hypothetical protein